MNLLPGVKERLNKAAEAAEAAENSRSPTLRPVPVDLPRAASKTRLVYDEDSAQDFLDLLDSVPVAAIALDSEYRFSRPPVDLRSGREWTDVRSQEPICFSLAAWVSSPLNSDGPDVVLRAVLDARTRAGRNALVEILRLRCPLVFHHVKAELFSLWALAIDVEIPSLYDTYLAAACLNLGSHHRRSLRAPAGQTDSEKIESAARLGRDRAHLLSLVGQCERYGIAYPFSGDKDDLRRVFLELGSDEPLPARLIDYAAADAEWTLRLYAAQQPDVLHAGIAHHLHTVEFPFAIANARIEWTGVHVDDGRREKLRSAAENAAQHYAEELRGQGIDPPGSRDRFLAVMRKAGLSDRFRRRDKPCTEDILLEALEGLHPAVRPFRLYQRYRRLASEEWLDGSLTGKDGRIHPRHRQLAAATGRNSCSTPNLAGIGRALRPVVTAPPGRAILELDYAQIEVGVAGAEYGDSDLVAAYNSGDVYVATARRFFADRLTAEERGSDAASFKQRRPDLRDQMKVFVLAVMYGVGVETLAIQLGVSKREAQASLDRFLDLFPALRARLDREVAFGPFRGHAPIVSGLRRRVEARRPVSNWTRNLLRNTPVQGSAAVVFKRAVVDIDRAFRRDDMLVVLPVHDSVVIECSAERIDEVTLRVRRVMQDALRSYYPELDPKVDVNASRPECWNKDGRANSLDRFLEDPTFRVDAAPPPTLKEGTLEFPPRGRAAHPLDDRPIDAKLAAAIDQTMRELEDGAKRSGVDVGRWHYEFEERAAILEFEAGLSREEAEEAAREWVLNRLRQKLRSNEAQALPVGGPAGDDDA